MATRWLNTFALFAAAVALVAIGNIDRDKSNERLNVSYDPTRELFVDLNRQFIAKYQNETGRKLTIEPNDYNCARICRD
jgi:sulfate/thiosulfate transport system substrate-binding protein